MKIKAIVNIPQRKAKMRAHTATHILHAELCKIFPQTKQAGSLVDNDYLRFDFYAEKMLDNQQIQTIEDNINTIITQCENVEVKEMSFDEATKSLGAKAFFEDKYWDSVRVVKIGEDTPLSIELCGGTHCSNSSEIWAFVILNQEAVASGIKRISAYTWPKVIEKYHDIATILNQVNLAIWVKNSGQTLDKINKEFKEKQELSKKLEGLNTKIVASSLTTSKNYSEKVQDLDKIINVSLIPELEGINFKIITQEAKNIFSDQAVLIFSEEGNFAILDTKNNQAKKIQTELNLKWGGNDSTVQGREANILEKF